MALGDLSAIERYSDRGPEHLVAPVIHALSALPSDPAQAADVEALAARLAGRLRTQGKVAAALQVAAAGRRRTAELRMQEALAAFALGKDELAASVMLEDEQVAAVVGPHVRAARGEDAPAARPRGASRELRALQAAARAVGHAVRGEADKARGVLRRIDRSLKEQLLVRELEAVLDLDIPGRAVLATFVLHASEVVRTQGSVRRAILEEIAAHGTPEIMEVLDAHFSFVTPEERHGIRMRSARARLGSGGSPAAAVEAIRDLDPGVFPATERGAAALYRGFALLDEPQAAARAFDRAIELGGDLMEALRGKLLAAMGAVQEAAPGSREERRLTRAVAAAADRLARALEREVWGGALVGAAEEIAAAAWVDAGDAPAAEASIARARAAVGDSAAFDRIEIQALALRDPAAAHARVDALLARDRADVGAWCLKIDLMPTEEAQKAALIEAAAATGDPDLVEAAELIETGVEEGDGALAEGSKRAASRRVASPPPAAGGAR
jgi:hypothetical protein